MLSPILITHITFIQRTAPKAEKLTAQYPGNNLSPLSLCGMRWPILICHFQWSSTAFRAQYSHVQEMDQGFARKGPLVCGEPASLAAEFRKLE